MAGRVQLGDSKLRARRKRVRIIRLSSIVFCLILLFGGAIALTWAPFMRVTMVESIGATTIASTTLENFVSQNLTGSYYYFFPRNNIFLYPQKELEQKILAHFPAIKSVSVSSSVFSRGTHTLSVHFVERHPVALWCSAHSLAGADCYLLDEDGYAYMQSPSHSGQVYVAYSGSLVAKEPPSHYLTPDAFHSISAFISALQAKVPDAKIVSVSIDVNADARVSFDNGFVCMYATSDTVVDVLQRFDLARTAAPFTQHALGAFEYLDLRFGDKLYYKLK